MMCLDSKIVVEQQLDCRYLLETVGDCNNHLASVMWYDDSQQFHSVADLCVARYSCVSVQWHIQNDIG